MPINVLIPHGLLTRALRFTVVVGVMLLVPSALVGCGGKESASPAGSVTPTVADSPAGVSPSPSIPPKPDDTYPWEAPQAPSTMYEHTEEGAIATAEYFVELMGYMDSTGKTQSFDELTDDGCDYCQLQMENTKLNWGNGGWLSGYATRDKQLLMSMLSNGEFPGERAVIFRVFSPEYEYYLPNQGLEPEYGIREGSQFEVAVTLDWDGSKWHVSGASGRSVQE